MQHSSFLMKHSSPGSPWRYPTKSIMFNTNFIIFNGNFIILNAKSIVFNTNLRPLSKGDRRAGNQELQNSSFLMQNSSSIIIHNSSFLMHNSSFWMTYKIHHVYSRQWSSLNTCRRLIDLSLSLLCCPRRMRPITIGCFCISGLHHFSMKAAQPLFYSKINIFQ